MVITNNNKRQEAVSFLRKMGIYYVLELATANEIAYFAGFLYPENGIPNKKYLENFAAAQKSQGL